MDTNDNRTDPLGIVRHWLAAERGLAMDANDVVTVADDDQLPIEVRHFDDEVVLSHRLVEPGAPATRVDEVVAALADSTPGVSTEVLYEDGVMRVLLTSRIATHRLTRNSVLGAIYAIAGLAEAALAPASVSPATVATPAMYADPFTDQFAPVEPNIFAPVEPNIFAPVEPNIFAPVEPGIEATQLMAPITDAVVADIGTDHTRVLERLWAPSHVVPKGGLPAWQTPDGRVPASVTLEPRVELTIAERRGDWARVVGENGWTGWVDGRRLATRSEPAVAAAVTVAKPAAHDEPKERRSTSIVMPLLGLTALGASMILPWLRSDDGSLSALEVPLAFLWDRGAASQPALLWPLLLLALILVTVMLLPRGRLLFIPLGLVVLAVSLLFAAQVIRGVMSDGGTIADGLSRVGPAAIVAFLAGGLVLGSAKRGRD